MVAPFLFGYVLVNDSKEEIIILYMIGKFLILASFLMFMGGLVSYLTSENVQG